MDLLCCGQILLFFVVSIVLASYRYFEFLHEIDPEPKRGNTSPSLTPRIVEVPVLASETSP